MVRVSRGACLEGALDLGQGAQVASTIRVRHHAPPPVELQLIGGIGRPSTDVGSRATDARPRPRTFTAGLGLVLLTVFTGCGGGSGPAAPVTTVASVTVAPAVDTLAVGDGVQLMALLKDAAGNPLTGPSVTWATSNAGLVSVSSAGLVTGVSAGTAIITATSQGKQGTAMVTAQGPVAAIAVSPATAMFPVRSALQLAVVVTDATGRMLSARIVRWSSSRPAVATVDSTGLVAGVLADTASVTAAAGGRSATALLRISPSTLRIRGLVAGFERRGWPSEYWNGEVLQRWDSLDAVVGTTVSTEVALQLDTIRSFGVNTVRYELRTADSVAINDGFMPPTCNIAPVLGVRWPQPMALELQKLVAFFDLAQSKGMHIILELINTHMEETPPTNSSTWLGAILGAVKNHPALALVLLDGSPHTVATSGGTVCGPPAEAPLWLGPGSVPANYVQWAVGYGRSLGLPTRMVSAEAVVGDYFTLSQPPAGSDATNGHLWDPIVVAKDIFDALQIPDSGRTYGLSFYEHRKCATAQNLPCTDTDPDTWADQTLTHVFAVIGTASRARVIAGEMGNYVPVSASWTTSQALQSLVTQMRRHGVEGGGFWRWVSYSNAEDADPTLAQPVKIRGVTFTYNPVKTVLAQLYLAP